MLHLFALVSAVVMLVEHVRSDVRAVADDVFGNLAVEVMGDPSSPQCVRTDARGAVERLVVHHGLAALGITAVRALPSGNARPRVAVAVAAECRPMHSSFWRSDERSATVLVLGVWSLVRDPVVEQLAHLVRERDVSFAVLSVLDVRPGLRAMLDGDELVVGFVVVDVEGVNGTDPHHGVPHEGERDMRSGSVLELLEVGEDLLGSVGVEHHVANVLAVAQDGRPDLRVEVGFDGVDGLGPLDDVAEDKNHPDCPKRGEISESRRSQRTRREYPQPTQNTEVVASSVPHDSPTESANHGFHSCGGCSRNSTIALVNSFRCSSNAPWPVSSRMWAVAFGISSSIARRSSASKRTSSSPPRTRVSGSMDDSTAVESWSRHAYADAVKSVGYGGSFTIPGSRNREP